MADVVMITLRVCFVFPFDEPWLWLHVYCGRKWWGFATGSCLPRSLILVLHIETSGDIRDRNCTGSITGSLVPMLSRKLWGTASKFVLMYFLVGAALLRDL